MKIQGAFLNQIAGYGNADTKEKEPVYCVLEVRDKGEKDGFLIAALYLDGSKITEKVEPQKSYLTHLGTYTEEEPKTPDEEMPDGDPDGQEFPDDWDFMEEVPQDDIINGYKKMDELDKAIKRRKKEIKTAELDIRGSNLKIQNVEKKLENQTVESILNGVVKKVGDPSKGEVDGEAFLVVESAEGSYVKGLADEYQLQQLQPGSVLTGFTYESGLPVEAEVKRYPISRPPTICTVTAERYHITPLLPISKTATALKIWRVSAWNFPQSRRIPQVFTSASNLYGIKTARILSTWRTRIISLKSGRCRWEKISTAVCWKLKAVSQRRTTLLSHMARR